MIKNGSPRASSLGSAPRLVVVVGNPKPRSRTLAVAELVADRVLNATGATLVGTVDLADYGDAMFRWPDNGLRVISEGVAAADIAVVASPVFKGSFTGLLKAFLDRYPCQALAGSVAVPVMTGAGLQHSLAVDLALTPLLAELGATLPARGLFFDVARMDTASSVVNEWAVSNLSYLRGTTALY